MAIKKEVPIHKSDLFTWDKEAKTGTTTVAKMVDAGHHQLDFNGVFHIVSVDTKRLISCRWVDQTPDLEKYEIYSWHDVDAHMKEWKIIVKKNL